MKLPSTTPSRGGQLVFAIAFAVFAVLLLSQLTAETKYSAGKQLFAQPRFWPGASVVGMVLFGLAYLWQSLRAGTGRVGPELLLWVRSLEFLAWFMAYVFAVPQIGYLLATVLFMALLVFRLGYRSTGTLFKAMLVGFVVVLIFKTGLAVQIPGGAIYEYLPQALRSFMITNF